MFQNAASYNGYLTELCQAAYADEADSISRKLFPTVGVKTAVGSYKKRDIDNAFRVYKTALSRGNSPTRIDTNATDDFYNCKPHALEVGSWKFDMEQDGGGDDERESNLQDLISSQLVTREVEAVTIWKAGVPVTAGSGNWTSTAGQKANIVQELDNMALTIQAAIGRKPTHLILGLKAWVTMKNHPFFVNRLQGLELTASLDILKNMLVFQDLDVSLASMPYQPAARGKSGKMQGIMGSDIFMFYSQDAPTRNDMSAAKDFTLEPSGPEILSEERTLEVVDMMYWSTHRKVTNPAAAARIEVS